MESKKFRVTVGRTTTKYKSFVVAAEDQNAAVSEAMRQASDYDYGQVSEGGDAEYSTCDPELL